MTSRKAENRKGLQSCVVSAFNKRIFYSILRKVTDAATSDQNQDFINPFEQWTVVFYRTRLVVLQLTSSICVTVGKIWLIYTAIFNVFFCN